MENSTREQTPDQYSSDLAAEIYQSLATSLESSTRGWIPNGDSYPTNPYPCVTWEELATESIMAFMTGYYNSLGFDIVECETNIDGSQIDVTARLMPRESEVTFFLTSAVQDLFKLDERCPDPRWGKRSKVDEPDQDDGERLVAPFVMAGLTGEDCSNSPWIPTEEDILEEYVRISGFGSDVSLDEMPTSDLESKPRPRYGWRVSNDG